MKTGLFAFLAAICVFFILVISIVIMYFTYSNAEIRLRNQITAKQEDNKNQLDNTTKKISQTAQVTQEQMEALKGIITGYADARGGSGGSLAKFIKEAVPNIDTKTFENLQNIIVSSRDTWTANQRALLDLKREHDNCLTVAPSSFFVGGRPPITVVIVTSGRTKESFRTGEDNDIELFNKKK